MPRVSIAMPVRNGERYLGQAIESHLAQSFADFELLVCDNASTDATEEICRRYAAEDARIHYHRNERDIGAAPNFNRGFELSGEAPYFKWSAHDDRIAPELLERCVEVLDRDPSVVVAYPKVTIIDEGSNPVEPYDVTLPTDSPAPHERFRALLRGHKCFEVFGLIRREALLRTPLIGRHAHGDGVLLSRLALIGRFEEVPERLFFPRRHGEQSMRMLRDPHAYTAWFDKELEGRLVFPQWRILAEYIESIHRAPLGFGERMRCYRALGYWIRTRRRLLRGNLTWPIKRLLKRAFRGTRP